jgi:hypothetical protein
MGGSGGGFRVTQREADDFREQIRERAEQQRLDADINSYLRRELLAANDRDLDAVNTRIDEIKEALGNEVVDVEDLRFGGSIAKHTYVEGLSDVDLVVPLRDEQLAEGSPEEFRREFADRLRGNLPMGDVDNIRVGQRAVTVVYNDGTEIQLLPAVKRGETISISSTDGREWQTGIRPKAFATQLTDTNSAQGGTVVPAIKLAKEIIASQVAQGRAPTGYHVEALAVDAFRTYDGPRTPKAMVEHLFRTAAARVHTPLPDVTGQSTYVDDSLGAANSQQRQTLARNLTNLANRMTHAQTVDDWKRLFGL